MCHEQPQSRTHYFLLPSVFLLLPKLKILNKVRRFDTSEQVIAFFAAGTPCYYKLMSQGNKEVHY